jgi:hypothetical protein
MRSKLRWRLPPLSPAPSPVQDCPADLGGRWPSRLVATAEENRLNIQLIRCDDVSRLVKGPALAVFTASVDGILGPTADMLWRRQR